MPMGMVKLKIYHNTRCSKSRQTLELIRKLGVAVEIIEYLSHPPTVSQLGVLLKQLNLSAEQLIRKKEASFAELGLKVNPPRSEAEWLLVLAENPILMERPIISNGKRAVIGRPSEKVLEILW